MYWRPLSSNSKNMIFYNSLDLYSGKKVSAYHDGSAFSQHHYVGPQTSPTHEGWVVCLVFDVPLENSHSYGDVTITDEGLQSWPILGTHDH